jgi:hypothetical protein
MERNLHPSVAGQKTDMKAKTKAETEHMGRVASLGCIICGKDAEIHHITGGKSLSQRASHFEVLPLCFEHHSAQTPLSFGHTVHKGVKSFEKNYGTQTELLAKTRKALSEKYPEYNPENGEKYA